MPYEYWEKIVTSDVTFHAWAKSISELFSEAGDALIGVMVESLESIDPVEQTVVRLQNDSIEMLLLDVLQEQIFQKDAYGKLFRYKNSNVERRGDHYYFEGVAQGEPMNGPKHCLQVDVKAVTMHMFNVTEKNGLWEATVVLDI